MEYLPLQVAQNYFRELETRPGFSWSNVYGVMKEVIQSFYKNAINVNLPTDVFPETSTEYLKTVLDENFMVGKNSRFEEAMLPGLEYSNVLAGYTLKDFKDNPALDPRTEFRDLIASEILLYEWIKSKQVLKLDKTFACHLMQTDKLKLTKNIFNHIPLKNFYIDLSETGDMFGDIGGVFVNILQTSDICYAFTLKMVHKKTAALFSCYNSFHFEVGDEIEIETEEFSESEMTRDQIRNEEVELPVRKIKTLAFQLACYMNVPKPDIVENPKMKNSYHPNKSIKNKFREVYMQDVGIRIGSKIRNKEKAVVKAYKEAEGRNGSPKSPHFRRAHWHGYWTGKGRTVWELKWIEPVFVCGNISSDVVIHEVE